MRSQLVETDRAANAPGFAFATPTGRRRDRARKHRMPNSLADTTGLNVSAEDFLAAVLETAGQPI
jgi:hypothetical protein